MSDYIYDLVNRIENPLQNPDEPIFVVSNALNESLISLIRDGEIKRDMTIVANNPRIYFKTDQQKTPDKSSIKKFNTFLEGEK